MAVPVASAMDMLLMAALIVVFMIEGMIVAVMMAAVVLMAVFLVGAVSMEKVSLGVGTAAVVLGMGEGITHEKTPVTT